jgi:hypothetical protein
LKDYQRYGLVVKNGEPVLFVLLDKRTLSKIKMEVSDHFQDPAIFLPCKTARWEHSTIDEEFERTLDVDDEVREVSRVLNAEEGGVVVVRNIGITAYAISCSLPDTFEERLIVLLPPYSFHLLITHRYRSNYSNIIPMNSFHSKQS